MWNLCNSINCTCIICIVLLWLIPYPIVIWLTCGSMECNKDVCIMYARTHVCTVCVCVCHHHHQWRYSPHQVLPSLTGFMIVIVRCGLSAPRSTWFYTPWFSHQRHLVVTTRDSIGEAGKHGWEMAAEVCLRGNVCMYCKHCHVRLYGPTMQLNTFDDTQSLNPYSSPK
jgi:hypothetical protein